MTPAAMGSLRTTPARMYYAGAREGTTVGYETLIVERAGAVATITFNRPEARNALDLMIRQTPAEVLRTLA